MKRKRQREGDKSLACIASDPQHLQRERGEGLGSHESMNY